MGIGPRLRLDILIQPAKIDTMKPTQSYTILWSKGPMDNPDDGTFEVMATDFDDACAQARNLMMPDPDYVDGIILTDIWRDL